LRGAGRHQQFVSFSQRHVEGLRKIEQHLAARGAAAAFDKADVLLRDSGVE
jgi:hypothetical protein